MKNFLYDTMDLHLKPVDRIEFSKKDIRTGDILGSFRMDGLNAMLMYASGSNLTNLAMAIWL